VVESGIGIASDGADSGAVADAWARALFFSGTGNPGGIL
jgi:hypothetical protein